MNTRSYNTEQLCVQIINYLNDRKEILSFSGIESEAGLKKGTLTDLIYGKRKTISQISAYRIIVILKNVGFELRSIQDNKFYEKEICYNISRYLNKKIKVENLYTRKKDRETVLARQLSMIYRHKKMKLSQKEASEVYGFNHSTVAHSLNTIRNLTETDKEFVKTITKIGRKLNYDFKNI